MGVMIFGVLMAITFVFSGSAHSKDSLEINCSNAVDRGVIVLDNPPIMNCKDMKLVQMFVGSSLVLGPIPNVDALAEQLDALSKQEQKTDPSEEFEARKEKAYSEI